MIAGIILAAGASSRMGSPKALLEYRGETFLSRLIRILSDACDSVMVVLGHHADEIRASAPKVSTKAVQFVVNPDPDRGQLSSLQTALVALPADAEGFLFVPVDCPAVTEETVTRIAGAFRARESGTRLVIPRYRDRRGHPVCADRAMAVELLALPATGQARDVIRSHVAHTLYLHVADDPGVLADIDDPEAYRKLTELARANRIIV